MKETLSLSPSEKFQRERERETEGGREKWRKGRRRRV